MKKAMENPPELKSNTSCGWKDRAAVSQLFFGEEVRIRITPPQWGRTVIFQWLFSGERLRSVS